jgi:hypothetical protein
MIQARSGSTVQNATKKPPTILCYKPLTWFLLARSAKSASGRTRGNLKTGTRWGTIGSRPKSLTVRSDEYCPHCDNHFVLDAVTPKASLQVESEDVRVDARWDALYLQHDIY